MSVERAVIASSFVSRVNAIAASMKSPLKDSVLFREPEAPLEPPRRRDERKGREYVTLPEERVREIRERAAELAMERAPIVVPATFKMVFLTVVGITVSVGIAEIFMAMSWISPTANEQTVFQGMDTICKAGVGAIFGLLGGKVVQ